MRKFLLRWLIFSITIFVVAELFGLIEVESGSTLILAALILGVLNAWLKPLLIIITLPISFLTLGIFVIVINSFLLKLTDWLVSGFEVGGFFNAVLASICISIVSIILERIIDPNRTTRMTIFRRW
jgi:putative membrane protein